MQVWPHKDYPLREVGKLKFDRNPTNYFAEVEQASFSPAHMVPGIEASPDRVLQSRLFAYDDASRYRLGANYLQVCIGTILMIVRLLLFFGIDDISNAFHQIFWGSSGTAQSN